MKVLIVDDSNTMRQIIKRSLAKIGIDDCVEAKNGKEAVAAATDDIEMVFMDWNMPEMPGIDAVRAIRGAGNKVPIIMVTTEAEKRRVLEAVQAGITDYMIKPFTPDALCEKAQKHMPNGAA
jgi:two-component system, chemotaxis family, chemotaxis protein CheY